jgi:hypothetical protein
MCSLSNDEFEDFVKDDQSPKDFFVIEQLYQGLEYQHIVVNSLPCYISSGKKTKF